jgi:cell division protein FtsL
VSKPRDGHRLSGLLALLVLVALVVTATGIFPFRQIVAEGRAVELAEQKLAALEAENRRLEAEVAALYTPEEVERLAREQLGLVRPGEIGYVVVIPPEAETIEPEPEPELIEAEEGQPWWRDVWDFLTGRDLVGDG